jgi:hypothetical protein
VRVRAVGFQAIRDAEASAAAVWVYLEFSESSSKNGGSVCLQLAEYDGF